MKFTPQLSIHLVIYNSENKQMIIGECYRYIIIYFIDKGPIFLISMFPIYKLQDGWKVFMGE
jgi:hypothetical protein